MNWNKKKRQTIHAIEKVLNEISFENVTVLWGEIDFSLNLFSSLPFFTKFLIWVWWNVAKSNDEAQVRVVVVRGWRNTRIIHLKNNFLVAQSTGKVNSFRETWIFFFLLCNFSLHLMLHQFPNDQLFRFYLNNSGKERKVFTSETCEQIRITGFSCLFQHCRTIISWLNFSMRAKKKKFFTFSKNYHHYRKKKVFFYSIDFKLGRRFKMESFEFSPNTKLVTNLNAHEFSDKVKESIEASTSENINLSLAYQIPLTLFSKAFKIILNISYSKSVEEMKSW